MKIYLSVFVFILLLPALVNGQTVFKGGSKEKFETSRKLIEQNLNEQEKQKLEIAFRVLAFAAIYDKANSTAYKKLSFDALVWKRVNGKSIPEVYAMAETFVKEDHQRKIAKLEEGLKKQEARKEKTDQLKAKLSILQAKPIKADLVNGQLVISCAFTNQSDQKIETYSTVIGYSSTADEEDGWSCSKTNAGIGPLAPHETKELNCSYPFEEAKQNSKAILWDKIPFPITDFETYHLFPDCYADLVVINGTEYALGNNEFTRKEGRLLKEQQLLLKKLKEEKVSLDDLIITKK